MKNLFFIVLITFFASCNHNSETVKGDLYFKLVNFIPNSGFSKEKAKEIENLLDVIDIEKQENKEAKATFEYLAKLRRHHLLETPSIKLRCSGKDIKTISVDPKEYKKLNLYTHGYLNQSNSKLEVELHVITLEKGLYYSDKIISLKEVEGRTYFTP